VLRVRSRKRELASQLPSFDPHEIDVFKAKVMGETLADLYRRVVVDQYRGFITKVGNESEVIVSTVASLNWDVVPYGTADMILIRHESKTVLICEIKSAINSGNAAAHRGIEERQAGFRKGLSLLYPGYNLFCCLCVVHAPKIKSGFRKNSRHYDYTFLDQTMWALVGNDPDTQIYVLNRIPLHTEAPETAFSTDTNHIQVSENCCHHMRSKFPQVVNGGIPWDIYQHRKSYVMSDWRRMQAEGLLSDEAVVGTMLDPEPFLVACKPSYAEDSAVTLFDEDEAAAGTVSDGAVVGTVLDPEPSRKPSYEEGSAVALFGV